MSGRLADEDLEKLAHYVSVAKQSNPAPGTEQQAQVYVPQLDAALTELRQWRAFQAAGLEFTYIGWMSGQPPFWYAFKRDKNGRTLGQTYRGRTAYEAGVAALEGLRAIGAIG